MPHVHDFFKANIAGTRKSQVEVEGEPEKLAVLATRSPEGRHAIVLVNYAEQSRNVRLSVSPFERTAYSEFGFPTGYLYCDQNGIRKGTGVLFSKEGQAALTMPPYSAWCLTSAAVSIEE